LTGGGSGPIVFRKDAVRIGHYFNGGS